MGFVSAPGSLTHAPVAICSPAHRWVNSAVPLAVGAVFRRVRPKPPAGQRTTLLPRFNSAPGLEAFRRATNAQGAGHPPTRPGNPFRGELPPTCASRRGASVAAGLPRPASKPWHVGPAASSFGIGLPRLAALQSVVPVEHPRAPASKPTEVDRRRCRGSPAPSHLDDAGGEARRRSAWQVVRCDRIFDIPLPDEKPELCEWHGLSKRPSECVETHSVVDRGACAETAQFPGVPRTKPGSVRAVRRRADG